VTMPASVKKSYRALFDAEWWRFPPWIAVWQGPYYGFLATPP
jgi:hypothetical protein